MTSRDDLYKTAEVDTDATQSGLHKIIELIRGTWPESGGVAAVKLDIGVYLPQRRRDGHGKKLRGQ